MKKELGLPAMIAVIVVIVAVAAFLLYKGTGPRTDGPQHPVDMSKMMGGPSTSGKSGAPEKK